MKMEIIFMKTEKTQKIDQIKAVMLGHAVGDALGVPVEFQSRERLEKENSTKPE